MSESTICYAVVNDEYRGPMAVEVYRRRQDAEARARLGGSMRVEELAYHEGRPTPGRVKIYGVVVDENEDEGGEYVEIETRKTT